MTWELGPCSALARGALRPRSRFGGLLEPFVEGEATFFSREGRDLHTLSDFELHRDRRGIDRSIQLFTVASVLCELVMRLAPEHSDPKLYRALTEGLDGLHGEVDEATPARGLGYVWGVVNALGFQPEIDRCVGCGRPIGETRARFDFEAGGFAALRAGRPGRNWSRERSRPCDSWWRVAPPKEAARTADRAAGLPSSSGITWRRGAAQVPSVPEPPDVNGPVGAWRAET